MRQLVLVGVLAGVAHAEDYVAGVHLGAGRIGAGYEGEDAGGARDGWALAAGAEAGVTYDRFRFSIAFDYARLATKFDHGYTPEPLPPSNIVEHFGAVSAKVELDYDDYLLMWAGLGLAAEIANTNHIGYRYEVGIGSRFWHVGDNALRADFSGAHYELRYDSGSSVGRDQYGLSVGFERFF